LLDEPARRRRKSRFVPAESNASLYDPSFYTHHVERARRSAETVVPLLLDRYRPRSVVDVGCGLGAWLAVFREHGIDDVLGLDGEYVLRNDLEIPRSSFRAADLAQSISVGRGFDLALSLEVVEHLPAERAAPFVRMLTELAPVVVFSAAIPMQGGTGHVNEQWPSYWVSEFEALNYVALDFIRPAIWSDRNVDYWYAQNLLVFVDEDALPALPLLAAERERTRSSQLDVVHPSLYLKVQHSPERTLRRYAGAALRPLIERRR
jgi:SAM-dependent methyltransferase